MTAETEVSSQPVLLDRLEAGVLTLTLNRPERLNALNAALIEALSARDQARGGGPRLSRGSDHRRGPRFLRRRGPRRSGGQSRRAPARSRPVARQGYQSAHSRDSRSAEAGGVRGQRRGGGGRANLALACDIVLAAKSAQFLQAFVRVGLIPDAGGTFHLPRLVGDARARALMMLGDPIGAEAAEASGMIWRAVDDEDLMGEAHIVAERLAAGATHALGLLKRALAASPGASLDAQLDLERDLQREAGFGDEFTEGVRAFLDKRPPDFQRKPGA